MAQVVVAIFVESRYKVDRKKIRLLAAKILDEKGVSGKAEISIAIVGDRKMRELSKIYKGEDKTRNVLSFSQSEGEPVHTSSDALILGDVIISYPQVIREASKEEVLVDDKVAELVKHGIMHLLGINHE